MLSARRSLGLAPQAPPARRHLPLAPEARPVDRSTRPRYAVWEITLRCDLACRHCGSRAGRARPDELSTAECLDLVGQMADLGVREVTLIGGEAYLREDWLEIVGAIRARGMIATTTTGGRGMTKERALAAAEEGLGNLARYNVEERQGLEPVEPDRTESASDGALMLRIALPLPGVSLIEVRPAA